MNNVAINTEIKTITTLEIAEMMEMSHADLLKKIEGTNKIIGIIPVFSKGKIPLADYFIESVYSDAQGKPRKCYDVTKLGCDFLANKFTGEKGILFTAKYVKRFREMENFIESDEQLKSKFLLSIYNGGQDAIIASKELSELEVREATAPLLETIKEQTPKAEFHDTVHASTNSISVGKFSGVIQKNPKLKKFGRNTLFQWMRDNDYLCTCGDLKNKPTQIALSGGYMDYDEYVTDNGYGKSITTYKPLVTGKGQVYFTKKLLKECI